MTKKKGNTWQEVGYENICQAIDDPEFKFEEWSEELEKELRYLFKNGGYSTKVLASMTGLQEWSIRKKLGLVPKEDEIHPEGL